MSKVRNLVALAALAAGGCTYISQGEYDEFRLKLDEDEDGAPSSNDCDDTDPNRSNEMAEIPYDGIDNDCSLAADVEYDPGDLDVDGDTFPAMTQAEYEALPGRQLEFPIGWVDKDPDCDDDEKDVNPNQTVDVLYDGVDSDCGQENDFDGDADGYVASFDTTDAGAPIDEQDVLDYIAYYAAKPLSRRPIPQPVIDAWGPEASGPAQYGDCEDTREDWHPAGPGPAPAEDIPYDGKDYDCDGKDDFDADEDGHLPFGMEDEYDAYLQHYFLADPGKPFDDCADGPHHVDSPQLSLVEAAHVYTGAPETWYDGLDQDCARNNDYDQDGDTFVQDGDAADAADYVATWGYELEPFALVGDFPEGDCDDTDPGFAPNQLDLLWNGIDEDCDTLDDQSAFLFDPPGEELEWVEPANPEIMLLEDREFLIFTLATQVTVDSVRIDLAGRPIVFDRDARGPAVPTSVLERLWMRNIFGLDPDTLLFDRIDLASRDPEPIDRDGDGVDDPTGWIVSGALATTGADRTNQINMSSISSLLDPALNESYSPVIVPRQNSPVHPVSPLTGLDAAPLMSLSDPGFRTGISMVCAPEHIHAKVADGGFLLLQTPPTDPFTADTCFFEALPIEGDIAVIACDAGDCRRFVIDEVAVTFTEESSLPDEHWAWGDWEDGYTLLVDLEGDAFFRTDADPTTLVTVFSGEAIETFDLVDAGPAGLYAIGITTDDRILLENHHPTEGLRSQELVVSDPAFAVADPDPYGVAVEVGNGRLAIAVTLRDGGGTSEGTVGWTFVGLP